MDATRLTRRDIVGRATLAGIAATAGTWLGRVATAHAEEAPSRRAPSALADGKLIGLNYATIPGFLSKEQVALHHQRHYGGALKGLQRIESRLYGPGVVGDVAARRELGRAQSAKANSVILHELYFTGMRVGVGTPGKQLAAALKLRFGSLDRWRADFEACALASAGWAVLAAHPLNGRLYHVTSDAHDVGALWLARPLILVDMYEHAFYVDYRTDKAAYVKAFCKHIDWSAADLRFRAANS